ncbi:aspartate kinase homoserine dehydrogenase [Rickenella mellea]|uniref:Homoserine dehydrogenase n=1 Tax=Rickenella mellea TaxID=50990 RepID=A0A4Y7Q565_9AGAM|nr:aspartate kinase homoserine dehydrogenase [Rickenella mellea]
MSPAVAAAPKCLVAVIGVGLVGTEFVNQILTHLPSFVKIVALSSSKTWLNSSNADLTPANWRSALSTSGIKPDLNTLLSQLSEKAKQGHKVVVVDNTSSDAVAALYPQFLKEGLNVITPNKRAFSADQSLYREIVESSQLSGARFLNESTVGAGLPVISTLKDLVATGDKVKKVEGVFSGTMSYIFNNFSTSQAGGPSFSSVVTIAREKGYTEPHPADDLNGADVARKVTILSRCIPALASGLPRGYKDVNTTSLVPSQLAEITSGDEFIARLPEFDNHFASMRKTAHDKQKVIRYVGVVDVDKGEMKASVENYPFDHPFATALGGSDNIFMFHTERYGARPLIVQGAGAGAAVTAMGVLSDLLKLL